MKKGLMIYEKNKKMRLIIILVFILIIAIICGIVVNKNLKNDSSVSEDWVKIYLDYLENDISNAKDKKIFLTESKLYDDPLLVVYGEVENSMGKTFHIDIYAIENDEVIKPANYGYGCSNGECDIKFMYDVEHDEYNYFYYSKFDESYTYETIDSLIIEYETKNEEELAKNSNYIKYKYNTNPQASLYSDKTYVIDTGMELNEFTYKKDSKYIKEQFEILVSSYKNNKELGSKYSDKIEEELEKINIEDNSNLEEIPSVENNNFKVGTYTLKYGKYKACFNGSNCREFTLNSDGTAIFDGVQKYFRVEDYNFGQGVEDVSYPAIVFSDTKDGNPGPNVYTPYVSTNDCLMTDGEIECVNYIG